MRKIVIGMFVLGKVLMSAPIIDDSLDRLFKIVPRQHEIKYNNNLYEVDMRALLEHTAMIESNYARDKYENRHAISPYQYEPNTYKWSLSVSKDLVDYIEGELGCKIDPNNPEHSSYVAYIIYMSKLRYHRNLLDKFDVYGDLDWKIYKILYNSVKGASKHSTWIRRKAELRLRRIEDGSSSANQES